jgi:hypothetical protein
MKNTHPPAAPGGKNRIKGKETGKSNAIEERVKEK